MRIVMRSAAAVFLLTMSLATLSCNSSLTVSSQSSISSTFISVDALSTLTTRSGETITFTGELLSPKIDLLVNGTKVETQIKDSKHGTFKVPADTNPNPMIVEFLVNKQLVGKFSLVDSATADQIPVSLAPLNTVCSYYVVKDAAGNFAQGTAECGVRLPECSYEGQINCTTSSSFPAVAKDTLAPKVVVGETVAGVSGKAAKRPDDCSSDGQSACVVDGELFKAVELANVNAGDLRSGVTIAGIAGSLVEAPTVCANDGDSSCVVDGTNFKAASTALTIAGNIRAGVTLAGVSGDYPSASYPLAGADGTADLTAATFNTKLASSTGFEWFDSFGVRHLGAGNTNFAAGNIFKDKTMFGVTGTFTGVSAASISTFTATSDSSRNILAWTSSGSPAGYLVVRRASSPVSWNPIAATSYSVGSVDVDNEIIYKGSLLTFDDTTGVLGTNYYYTVFAYDNETVYSHPAAGVSAMFNAYVACGNSGNLCYDNATAIAAGSAKTPSGKYLTYVVSSGSFKVWREESGSRILKADGSDNWALQLNGDGLSFSATDFTYITKIIGRKCPPNVFLDQTNKFATNNCLYYAYEGSGGLSSDGTNGTNGIGNWATAKWFNGNIKKCADIGMRVPTMYETAKTDHAYESQHYPMSDGVPVWAESAGVPSNGEAWLATTGHDTQSYFTWNGTGLGGNYHGNTYNIACVLP